MFTEDTKLTDTLELGNRLIREFGLEGWTFEIANTKRRVGECNFDDRTIRYSAHFLWETELDEIEDTIRHEIAHALVGPKHGHDRAWKEMCLRVGARPQRLASEESVSKAEPNFIIECSNCGRQWKRFRLRKSLFGRNSICCNEPLEFYEIVKS